MSLFALLGRRRFRPAWQYTTRGILWGLYPARDGMMVGEERDLDAKTASYFCIDQRGNLRWKHQVQGESWWTGVETVYRDVLLLHGFATPDLPQHKGIVAVSLSDGSELWRNDEVTLIGVRGEEVLASEAKPGRRSDLTLALRTGEVIRNAEEAKGDVSSITADPDEKLPVEFPHSYSEEGRERPEIVKLLKNALSPGEVITGDAGFIELPGYTVFLYGVRDSHALPEGETSVLVVAVVSRESSSVVYRDSLGVSAPWSMAAPLLVRKGFMHYVKDHSTLVTVHLPG
jgi:hypothetical protein